MSAGDLEVGRAGGGGGDPMRQGAPAARRGDGGPMRRGGYAYEVGPATAELATRDGERFT